MHLSLWISCICLSTEKKVQAGLGPRMGMENNGTGIEMRRFGGKWEGQ
jgi:hypothetical protein